MSSTSCLFSVSFSDALVCWIFVSSFLETSVVRGSKLVSHDQEGFEFPLRISVQEG